MSEQQVPDHDSPAEVEIDLASFLPEGVDLAAETGNGGDGEFPLSAAGQSDLRPDEARPTPAEDAVDTALLGAVEADLAAVDDALRALDDGTYGTCAVCGHEIDGDLLRAEPVRLTCAEHA